MSALQSRDARLSEELSARLELVCIEDLVDCVTKECQRRCRRMPVPATQTTHSGESVREAFLRGLSWAERRVEAWTTAAAQLAARGL